MSESPTPGPSAAGDIPAPTPPPGAPTTSPTSSHSPSLPVTTVAPTLRPSPAPTISPVVPPTANPSRFETLEAEQGYATQLFVNEPRQMTPIEEEIFRGIMESHTERIGLEIGDPLIQTECTILQQELGDAGEDRTLLQVTYNMLWTSRYGYDEIYEYPELFKVYMDSNMGDVLESLRETLSITGDVIFIEEVGTTASVDVSSLMYPPTPTPGTMGVLFVETEKPTAITATPSAWPSAAPSIGALPTSLAGGSDDKRQGILIGVLVAFFGVVVGVIVAAIIRRNHMKQARRWETGDAEAMDGTLEDATQSQLERPIVLAAQDQFPGDSANGDEIIASAAVPLSPGDVEVGTVTTLETATTTQQPSLASTPQQASHMAAKGMYPTIDSLITVGSQWPNQMKVGEVDDTVISRALSGEASDPATQQSPGANLMIARSESFSTNSLDGTLSSNVTAGDGDEFDRYKNEILEKLWREVEESVEGVEGMLSLAITRVLMDADGALDMEWIGGEDLGSIEASCLCQAFEWERTNDSTTVTGRSFFEDLLNKVVFIVHHGLIRPNDGARILHGCACIVGMPLLKEPPNTTIAIYGLVSTNDVAQGHHILVETFAPFGDIVDASVAPQYRGFGFVRFVRAKSVDDVLKQHERSAIEIQDVAVTIHCLFEASF
ncbi:hypothetical protein ACHAXT_004159 [Thalassiosira profunda]